ncbi:restriction endonuclease subunit S [Komagataeibacter swingsii]|uniref:Restriction endonuclease subunit S n=1 Tax=Komagataeibacter swingsii TaxID=215220 RepID=A0A850NY15_9PROT|nr:restriction endonuclease subunit S [Komagataeibacter swingsii]NVN36114.1 restriction endonuclease subunit S [Komagataeibacter swingsii]
MSKELWAIPPSWTWAEIENVGRVVSGGTPSTKEASYWGKEIVWFSPADLSGYKTKYIARGAKSLSRKGLANSSAQIMPKGTVMFSSRAPIGYVAITSVEAATNQGFKSIVPADGIFNEYLYYYLKAAKYVAEERATGTTFKEISGSAFAKVPVPVAPTNEQRRIVAKIEELFSELDKGVESLTTAREQLKAYRQSLLKHAFAGKLTEEWRSSHDSTPSWQTVPVAELLAVPLCNGRSVKDRAGGFPVLRLTALKQGRMDLTENKQGAWDRTTAQPFLVAEGDFFVARGNGSKSLVGMGGLVGEVTHDVAFPDTMIRLRLDTSKVIPRYFALCWNSRLVRQQIERDARTTAGIYKINQDHVSAFTIPVPSLDEQTLIVERLEKRLLETAFLQQQAEDEVSRSAALYQSILRKAFSGQLVPQDPRDEPALVLLERIRAEQGEGTTKKRRNTKNGRKEAA